MKGSYAAKMLGRRLPVLLTALLTALLAAQRYGAVPASAGGAYTVVVDPGHGGADGGAVGADGTKEAGLNLAVSLLLRSELEARGARVILTREGPEALAGGKKADMAARRRVMNRPGVDMVISIHMNKFPDCSIRGPMAFYMKGSGEGERLAKLVIDSVTDAIGAPRRTANPGDYFVIRESRPVAVLVECGFLSNGADLKQLKDAGYRRKLARAIAEGAFMYLKEGNAMD